jgi:glyceraldehyde 3-phosphate dehydrogenase
MKGKMHGMALRVPTPNVSLVDLVADVQKNVTIEEVNKAFQQAAATNLRGILDFSEEPLVSIDYNTNPFSAIVDGLSTLVMADRKIKVLAWYDNEWGYSKRVVDLVKLVGRELFQQAELGMS